MLRLFAISIAALLAGCATAHHDIAKSCYHGNAAVETDIGYCEAVRIGNTLHISGSVGAGEMPAAMRKAYDTLKKTLAANGLDFHNVVKENVYATDLDAFIHNKDIRKEYYGADFPAATLGAGAASVPTRVRGRSGTDSAVSALSEAGRPAPLRQPLQAARSCAIIWFHIGSNSARTLAYEGRCCARCQ